VPGLIVNGGHSDVKIAAITGAKSYFALLSEHALVGADAPSLVREQPEIVRVLPDGTIEHEALTGARNRAHGAKKSRPDGTIFVGIESAVMDIGFIVDVAVIVVLDGDVEFHATSTGVAFPREDYDVARARGFDTTTVGKVIAERLKTDPTDPHYRLTGWRRSHTIADGVAVAFYAMLKARGEASTGRGG